jgi:hypothetical protein
VLSPDDRSCVEIKQAMRSELQAKGMGASDEHRIDVLVPRQDLTGADCTWAERYNVGDVMRYSRSSQETGIGKGVSASSSFLSKTAQKPHLPAHMLKTGGE